MSNVWFNLAWKEWHEHKWKTAALTAILPVFVLLGGRDFVANLALGATLVGTVGALFFAVGVAAGERADGSLNFVQSLPVERWKVATVRLSVSPALCIAPIVETAILVQGLAMAGAVHTSPGDLWGITLISCVACLSLFFWITATTIDQPNQLRVGVIGVVVFLTWLAIGVLLTLHQTRPSGLMQVVYNIGPACWWDLAGTIPFRWPESWIGLIGWGAGAMSVLFAVSVMNYGREAKPAWVRQGATDPTRAPRLGQPFRSPRWAIAWLQVTEAMPICVGGSFLLIAWSSILAFFFAQGGLLIDRAIDVLAKSAVGIGFLWVGVVGVSTFVPNLQSGLATFWRSRPISPGSWFWSKFWLGAIISLAAIHIPAMVAIDLIHKLASQDRTSVLIGYLCVPLTHLMIYSISVLAACLFRHIVYAGILGLCASAAIVLLPVLGRLDAGGVQSSRVIVDMFCFDIAQQRLSQFVESGFTVSSFHDLVFLPLVLLTLAVIVASSWTASWAVTRDIAIYR